MTPSNLGNRGHRSATNFLAARNAAFTALWCYARITPAALHCGKIDERRGEGAEAAGGRPEFWVSDFAHPYRWLSVAVRGSPGWHQLKQRMPDA
jgi:hypothetical protein